jgi:hypothetical protein
MVSLEQVRSYLRQVLHLRESPHRTALAFAVGAFIAFSPTYGLHTLSVIFCTWAFRLNFIAVMAGSLINNPWTVVPILGATFWTGFSLLGTPEVPSLSWQALDLKSLYGHILPYLFPFLLGAIVLSVAGALISYPAVYWFISQYGARTAQQQVGQGRLPPGTSLR